MSLLKILGSGADFVFGEYNYEHGSRFGPLLGPQMEIIFLRTGRVEILVDGARVDFVAPHFAFMASRSRLEYRYGSDEMCHVAWCQCTGPGLTIEAVRAVSAYAGILPPSDTAVALMKMGTEIPIHRDDDAPAFSNALALALFEEFFSRKRTNESQKQPIPQVELVHRHIERNIDKPLTMADLASLSGLSPQHLNRLYREAYGENPLDCLWRLRTRQGAFLLQHTGLRISQIAYQTGFKTPNHFSRRIRERFGLSPRALRARRWHGTENST